MAVKIDRQKVRESFHRQASEYEEHAIVQRRVIERLVQIIRAVQPHPKRLLDVGAGTGRLLAKLVELNPNASAAGADLAFAMCQAASEIVPSAQMVNAEAEKLPFQDASFDLVVSSSTFQWLTTLDGAFSEVERVLRPGGVFCFALFGEKTLFELRESYKSALTSGPDRSHSFFSKEEVHAALQRAGFSVPAVASELEVEFHADVPELLKSLKKIGAKTAGPVAAKGLSERRVMLKMMELYRERYRGDQGIPATYEVIYGVGRKSTSCGA